MALNQLLLLVPSQLLQCKPILFGHEPTGTYKNGTQTPMNTSKEKMHGTFMVYVARCHPASTRSNDLSAAHQGICKATFVQRLDAQHHVRLGDLLENLLQWLDRLGWEATNTTEERLACLRFNKTKKGAWTILEIITGLAYLVLWDARE